jgi:hypothetical protein
LAEFLCMRADSPLRRVAGTCAIVRKRRCGARSVALRSKHYTG